MSKYYDIKEDLQAYPEAWCLMAISKRGPGKTYSTLRYCIENNQRFIFMKRTIGDIELMCSRFDADSDISPFNPLNRDLGWSIYPVMIDVKSGLAGFYECTINDDGKPEPCGKLLGWIVSVTVASKFKGFNMDADMIIFDEFIPKPWERINHKEGEAVMDLYMTIARDRVKRGRKQLLLVLLANATSLTAPMLEVLRVTDQLAMMDVTDQDYYYSDTDLLIHKLGSEYKFAEEDETGIYRHMKGTAWGRMAFEGKFSYNDLTCIGKVNLKGYRPICSYALEGRITYVYRKDGNYYLTDAATQSPHLYNLDRESDQRAFFNDYVIKIRNSLIEDKARFKYYTDYDIILNYKRRFRL